MMHREPMSLIDRIRAQVQETHIPVDPYVIIAAIEYLEGRNIRANVDNVRRVVRRAYQSKEVHLLALRKIVSDTRALADHKVGE